LLAKARPTTGAANGSGSGCWSCGTGFCCHSITTRLNESIVEDGALEWFGWLRFSVGRGGASAALLRVKPQMASVHLGQMSEGGAYPAVRFETIGALRPDAPKTFEVFHHVYAPLFEQTEANLIRSRTLAILRDTLLPHMPASPEVSAAKTMRWME
jgi:hypothetical protein